MLIPNMQTEILHHVRIFSYNDMPIYANYQILCQFIAITKNDIPTKSVQATQIWLKITQWTYKSSSLNILFHVTVKKNVPRIYFSTYKKQQYKTAGPSSSCISSCSGCNSLGSLFLFLNSLSELFLKPITSLNQWEGKYLTYEYWKWILNKNSPASRIGGF